MNRKSLFLLEKWISDPHRKPLVIRGARQVGKSTLVRLFSEQQQRPLFEVNLERHPELAHAFESMNPADILNQIEALPRMPRAVAADSILFLDEIQATPKAVTALRYFYEEQLQLPVIAAGSLLEFILSHRQFSMPVGRVEYLHLGPMTFTEFLEALGENKLRKAIDTYELGGTVGPVVHERLLQLLRSYYFVGGMPEAVAAFSKARKLSDVSPIHRSILETYRDDLPKYIGKRNQARIWNVFSFAARNVGTKIKYSNISSEEASSTLKQDIELLCHAQIINKVIHSHASGMPLQAMLEEKIYKLLFLDVGLMNALSGLSWESLAKQEHTRLISEGAIAEQFIGQHLSALLSNTLNRELTYWVREGKANNAEVDFVVAFDGRIFPIEVKAGAKGGLRSLHQFMAEKKSKLAVRFDGNEPSRQRVQISIPVKSQTQNVQYQLLSLPLYLVERLPALLTQV